MRTAQKRFEMEREQQEYAPRYSLRERIRHAIVGVGCVSIFFAFWQWWALPQWSEFARTAHCRTVLGFAGSSVMLYVVFVAVPLAIAISLGAFMVPAALRSIRARQYPPPGQKVHGKVRIRTGRIAVVSAAGDLALIAAFVGIALWGSQQPRQILEQAQPKRDATCSGVRSESPKAIASLDGEAMREGTLSAGDTR
ncbi:hypothetical protein [Steroidobacter agaridevorans]|uniref:hypothetical protein n=1 Tax=Steroidobacter agaridevorans TaxID=2695856 RepID=UPI00137A1ECF|nr:hypothetical protein [Steroidobacter agaridevorans]